MESDFGNRQIEALAEAVESGATLILSGARGSLIHRFATAPRANEPTPPPPAGKRPTIVFEDFESGTYDKLDHHGRGLRQEARHRHARRPAARQRLSREVPRQYLSRRRRADRHRHVQALHRRAPLHQLPHRLTSIPIALNSSSIFRYVSSQSMSMWLRTW